MRKDDATATVSGPEYERRARTHTGQTAIVIYNVPALKAFCPIHHMNDFDIFFRSEEQSKRGLTAQEDMWYDYRFIIHPLPMLSAVTHRSPYPMQLCIHDVDSYVMHEINNAHAACYPRLICYVCCVAHRSNVGNPITLFKTSSHRRLYLPNDSQWVQHISVR